MSFSFPEFLFRYVALYLELWSMQPAEPGIPLFRYTHDVPCRTRAFVYILSEAQVYRYLVGGISTLHWKIIGVNHHMRSYDLCL